VCGLLNHFAVYWNVQKVLYRSVCPEVVVSLTEGVLTDRRNSSSC